jgi:hypothetical protein
MNTCTNCANEFEGKFCNQCGQKVFTDADKSIWLMVKDALHFITHFEGTIFTSLRNILFRPGRMSLDYCNGKRKIYFRPISLYLLIVVLYLLSPFARGLNMSLQLHSKHSLYGKTASRQISAKMAASVKSMEYLATRYSAISEKVSKVLLLLLIPLTALLLRLLFVWKKKLWFDFFVLATEINILYIVLFFFLIPITLQLTSLLIPNFYQHLGGEDTLLIPVLIIFAVFMFSMFRRFFGAPWYTTAIMALVFPFLFFSIDQFIYRFLLFEVSFSFV